MKTYLFSLKSKNLSVSRGVFLIDARGGGGGDCIQNQSWQERKKRKLEGLSHFCHMKAILNDSQKTIASPEQINQSRLF